jgi:hypothetical protein
MFELEDGTIAPADKTPEQVIVYSLSEYVDDPKYIDSGGETGVKTISGEFYTEGRYTKHIGRFDYDERGNIINSTHMGTRNMYYIPYDPQTIRDLLAKYPHDRTLSFACAVAKESGSDPYYGNPRSVKNIDEFCDVEDIDGLISANIGNKKIPGSDAGTFLSEEYGGYQEWKLYREKLRQERMETPIDKLESKADTITKTQSTVKKSKYQYRPPEND